MAVGERIKRLREALEMTQETLAKQIDTTKQTIYKYENGIITNIPSDKLEKLAEVLKTTPAFLMGWKVEKDPNLNGLTNVSVPSGRWVPILGNICAGDGILCEENYNGAFFVDDSIKADLCVRVHGDSMIDAGIYDSDMVFIKKDYDYEDGKIYAVRINSDCEAVLKKVTLKDDIMVLAPCNVASDYQAMIERSDNVSIIGECVGVYHSTV